MKKLILNESYVCVKKHLVLFIVFLSICQLKAQPNVLHEKIDSLITASNVHKSKFELKKVIENGFEIIRLSEQENYDKGIIEGYFFISGVLSKKGEYKKSLEYVEKVKHFEDNYLKNNPSYAFRYYFQKTDLFYIMELPSQAKRTFKMAENAALVEENLEKKNNNLFILYTRCFYFTDDLKEIYNCLLKAEKIVNDSHYKQDDFFTRNLDKITFYYFMGNNVYQENKLEEALAYYYTALNLTVSIGGHYTEGDIYLQLGNIYRDKKQYKKAVGAYQKAERIFENYNFDLDTNTLYSNLIILYKMMGDVKEEEKYIVLKSRLVEKLEKEKRISRDQSILILINARENLIVEEQHKKRNAFAVTTFIFTISLSALGGSLFLIKKYKKKQEHIIDKFENKTNLDYIEIMELAKSKSLDFWDRFQEVYPYFKINLLKINKKITPSELLLAAYIYLDFTTNEIAELTFRSIRTVENTRYNLRKKLELSSETNLKDYLKQLI